MIKFYQEIPFNFRETDLFNFKEEVIELIFKIRIISTGKFG